MTTYILVTQPVYADIHPGLVTIPLDMEQEFTVPYGLMIANDPSPAVKRFISAVERIRDIHIQNGIFSDKPQSQLFRFPVILPEPASSGMNESPANTASAPQGC